MSQRLQSDLRVSVCELNLAFGPWPAPHGGRLQSALTWSLAIAIAEDGCRFICNSLASARVCRGYLQLYRHKRNRFVLLKKKLAVKMSESFVLARLGR